MKPSGDFSSEGFLCLYSIMFTKHNHIEESVWKYFEFTKLNKYFPSLPTGSLPDSELF